MKRTHVLSGLLAFCMAVSSFSAMTAGAVNLHDESTMTDEEKMIKEYCDIVVNMVNNERVARGLTELKTFPELNEVTCIRAEELTQSFTHTRPGGSMCFSVVKDANIGYSLIAENIAAGRADPVSTVEQWMGSTGHRKNILGEKYTHIGIGYFYRPNTPELQEEFDRIAESLKDDPDAESKLANLYNYEYYWSMFLIGSYQGSQPYVFPTQYQPTRGLGDADGSHGVNASDASMILTYSASHAAGITFPVVHDFNDAADVNGDGFIDAIDASIILAYSAAVGAGNGAQISDFVW